ncbi:MAG: site-specific DNA-methyltransferase, partial [Atribacterota bacterium]|nr:site-specific DNA-methyltransferase [Atribacterota bacterium]
KLRQLFPEVFTEDGIDFDRLKQTLGESIDTEKERYSMTWPGKSEAFQLIQNPSIGTLKPARDESVNFDNSENLFIEGDNLEVLKLLQKSYYGKIKMIYIDPPYNTGNDFIYPDDFKENLSTYLQYTGQVDAEGRKFSTNTDTEGRFHSKWLNMMYPRLFLAKNLLRDDGVIFISIDDNEVCNLRKICDEIFGEENFVAVLLKKSKIGGGSDTKYIIKEHEYIICYSKNISRLPEMFVKHDREYLKRYKEEDENGKYFWDTFARPGLKNPINYDIVAPDGSVINGDWIRSKNRFERDLEKGEIRFVKKNGGDWSVQFKQRLNIEGRKPRSLSSDFGGTIEGKNEIRELLKNERIFLYPKSSKLLKYLINIINDKDAFILDFFAGSATTAHAVLDLNKEDGGNRKFIMVQLPEKCDEKSESYKAGFKTIADIGKERIRRVIAKIKQENSQSLFKNQLDLGFKSFKLDSSNFKIWNTEGISPEQEALEKQLELHINHINPDSSQEDILFEILLKAGYQLSDKVKKIELAGKNVYSVNEGAMLICLEKELTKEVIKAMAERKPGRVICLDQGFANNDQLKTNAVQIMKSKGIDDFRTV